jgi:hypothetical protein
VGDEPLSKVRQGRRRQEPSVGWQQPLGWGHNAAIAGGHDHSLDAASATVALRKRGSSRRESRRSRAGPGPRTLGFGDGDSEVDDARGGPTAGVMPMHDWVDGDRPLTFAFVLGGGLRSSRAIGPTRPRL